MVKKLEHIERAIQKAIDAGWNYKLLDSYKWDKGEFSDALLDPEFWKSLGKAEEWVDVGKDLEDKSWYIVWTDFIYHIAQGKSIDDFFNNLIN